MSRGRRLLAWGGGLAGLLAALVIAAPLLAPHSPDEQVDPPAAMRRPPGTTLAAVHLAGDRWRLAERVWREPGKVLIERRGKVEEYPEEQVLNETPEGVAGRRVFLLGSDALGRDVWSRMLHGGRVSLLIGLLGVVLAMTLGTAIGGAAALGGRVVDSLLMRGVDAILSFPRLFLLLGIVALLGPSTPLLVLLLGGTTWMGISRLARAEILTLKQREFVLAARGAGLAPLAIFWRHLLPGAMGPLLVQATLLIGDVILLESALSFLGLGVQPPQPSWGNMVADGQAELTSAWWVAVFPGIAIALTVIALNLLGDGLRDLLDPRSRREVPAERG
jgi:peptide/nickel transport system permease protein